jgi:hypothetical protein
VTLQADASGLSDLDGLGAFSYQWFADGAEIADAILETFTTSENEAGKQIYVEVRFNDGVGAIELIFNEPIIFEPLGILHEFI